MLQEPTLSIKQVNNVVIESEGYGFSHRLLHTHHASGALFFADRCVAVDMRLQHVPRQLGL
jgi:HPt (histidine-containing phosphotransfer) domain-containing protein